MNEQEMPPVEVVAFGRFRFHSRTGHLYRDNDRLELSASSGLVLSRLLDRAGELVPFEDLVRGTSGDSSAAAPEALRTAIRQLRVLLRDPADHPMYIATERGRGYRFIAPVAPPEWSRGPHSKAVDTSRTPSEDLVRWTADDEVAIDFSVTWLAGAVPLTLIVATWQAIPLVMLPPAIRIAARWLAFRQLRRRGVAAGAFRNAMMWADQRIRETRTTTGWRSWLRRTLRMKAHRRWRALLTRNLAREPDDGDSYDQLARMEVEVLVSGSSGPPNQAVSA